MLRVKKTKSWLKVILINFFVLFVCLTFVEIIFGSIFFGENYGLLIVDRKVNRIFDTSNRYGGGVTRYIRDEHGLRGKYSDLSKIDILTIGGSTTNEILIDEGKTWSDRLALQFKAINRTITVVNAGIDGQSTVGHLKLFDHWFNKIPNFKPNYILAFIGINDLSHLYKELNTLKGDGMHVERKFIKTYLKNNSAIYGFYRTFKGMLYARNAMFVHSNRVGPYEWKQKISLPETKVIEKLHKPFLDAYENRVHKLIKKIRDFGSVPIIVTQHTGHYRLRKKNVFGRITKKRIKNDWFTGPVNKGGISIGPYAVLMAHNRRAIKACENANAICIDVSKHLIFERGDHYDLIHTTPKGSSKIASFIFNKLKGKIY